MSYRKLPSIQRHTTKKRSAEQGFTLVELVVTITLTLLVSTVFYSFFKTSISSYLGLQKDASGLTDLAMQTQRIAGVVRGATDIVSASGNDLVIYAYFYPTDTYVSLTHYYLSSDAKTLYADVTPMTSNPPVGMPISAKLKTYTILSTFQQTSGQTLFNYLDSAGNTLSLPISDLRTIKGIQVNLAVATSSGNEVNSLQVSLRNRKNNL